MRLKLESQVHFSWKLLSRVMRTPDAPDSPSPAAEALHFTNI